MPCFFFHSSKEEGDPSEEPVMRKMEDRNVAMRNKRTTFRMQIVGFIIISYEIYWIKLNSFAAVLDLIK